MPVKVRHIYQYISKIGLVTWSVKSLCRWFCSLSACFMITWLIISSSCLWQLVPDFISSCYMVLYQLTVSVNPQISSEGKNDGLLLSVPGKRPKYPRAHHDLGHTPSEKYVDLSNIYLCTRAYIIHPSIHPSIHAYIHTYIHTYIYVYRQTADRQYAVL